ncbi:LacI family transcriptional regulator [Roseococcus sp. SYP-B2431]|uniref:LacI family DNA-binding transcriptional regulator n=1 Tax=Roseococcus sp. SYP-B2431 TaxID=2496640 RepID=UPI00103CBF29|nr:LacI family DNA-binding transcriptional regulator [Roseococcus sp. SYP-B2431]TCH98299.1 LacI family transcriptional regulator [Roseococcus sp. SYP-B2431]
MARVTIREVAKAVGVSEATVSNALADKPIVTAETKARVRRAAEELGYHISPIARALRTGHSGTVGIVVSNLANPFYADILLGISSVLTPRGYQTMICNTESRPELQEWHVAHLLRHMVDGILLLSFSSETEDTTRALKAGVPLVALWRRPGGREATFVGMDDAKAMHTALEHLWSLGHRRIGLLRAHAASSPSDARQTAFNDFLTGRGAALDPGLVVGAEISIEGGRDATRRLLDLPEAPTALIATSDLMALGATIALADRGLSVPADMSVVGFEDTFVAALPQIRLTTVSVPRRELGLRAAELLLERIIDPAQPVRNVVLQPGFQIRGTTARVG